MIGWMAGDFHDIYRDGVIVNVTPYDVILQLQRRPADNAESATAQQEVVGCVRMSLEQAKTFAIILKTSLKQLEESQGTDIPIHPQLRANLKISKNEDW
jgi:hypothetical protein